MFDYAFCRSTGRSTETVGRPVRSTDVHKRAQAIWLEGRSTARELCSLDLAPVDRAVDRWHNDQKSDRWPVDRAVDRQQHQLLIWPVTTSF